MFSGRNLKMFRLSDHSNSRLSHTVEMLAPSTSVLSAVRRR